MCSLSCGLRLFNNQIGDQGATAIGEALKVNGALKLKKLIIDVYIDDPFLLLNHTALKAA